LTFSGRLGKIEYKFVFTHGDAAGSGISALFERRRQPMDAVAESLLDFIEKSPTPFHVVENIREKLLARGYVELGENQGWRLHWGGKYFVVRNHSSLIALSLPERLGKGYHMAASHTDSPAFKIKINPDIATEEYVKLNTEKYGGMILSTWLDRPLSVAGRVFVEGEEGMEEHLIQFDRNLLVIPNLAVHMNREINKGYAYNPQVDMLPIFSQEKDARLRKLVAEELGVPEQDILSEELFVYVRQRGCAVGDRGQWMLAPRLDDLQCVYASLEGLLASGQGENIALCAFFDNEEVGSGTKQGADSTLLQDVLERIGESLSISREEQRQMLARSFLLSADNAHALHPNHPEKADPTNRPRMNGGIVVKYHGGQKYTTDGYSSAFVEKLCREAQVPSQTYCNRSDVAGGSTLGNISAAHVSVPSADIGFAQLAMHSALETAGVEDVSYGVKFFETFFSR